VKQSRFKQIVSEELALSRVGLREGYNATEHVAQGCRAVLDSLTSVLAQLATLEEDLKERVPDLASEFSTSYDMIRAEMQRLAGVYKKLK